MLIKDILEGALILSQVISQGEEIQGLDNLNVTNSAIKTLQSMLLSWGARKIIIPVTDIEKITISANQDYYSFAPPSPIENFRNVHYISNIYISYDNDYLLNPLSEDQYFSISNKKLSGIPQKYYFKYLHDGSGFYIYPVPSSSIKATVSCFKSLLKIDGSSFDLDANLNLPDAYFQALKYNLALHLCSDYATEPSSEIVMTAQSSLNGLSLLGNKYPPTLKTDIPNVQYTF